MSNTILSTLHDYKSFIENELKKEDYKLMKSPPLNQHGKERPTEVIPAVTTGCLPHANFSLYGAENELLQAPYIMIGFEEGSVDYEEAGIQLLIQVCCYSSSSYVTDETNELYDLDIPDNKAFEDCLNLLEWLQNKFIAKGVISGTAIGRPIRIGSYNTKELTYPYSFGYLSFPVNTVTKEISRKKYNY